MQIIVVLGVYQGCFFVIADFQRVFTFFVINAPETFIGVSVFVIYRQGLLIILNGLVPISFRLFQLGQGVVVIGAFFSQSPGRATKCILYEIYGNRQIKILRGVVFVS